MTYYPTDEDLQMLKSRALEIYCRLELLDVNMQPISSLEGVTMDGSISVDADSDTRRTFSGTIYLSDDYDISNFTEEDWIDKYIRVYIGFKNARGTTKWWSQGVFAFSQNGFQYSETENTISISGVDLVAMLDGTLNGYLGGGTTEILEGNEIRSVIIETFKLSNFSKYVIDYWNRTIPYDLEYDIGCSIWDILSELRDLYYPFEMYFDDDTFVCKEIPSGYDDPVVLDPDIFADLVISEDATVDYSEVKNVVEVFGATIESDYYSDEVAYSNGTLTLGVTDADTTTDINFSFLAPCDFTGESLHMIVNNTLTEGDAVSYESDVYQISTDEYGEDVLQDPTVIKSGKYYVIEYSVDYDKFYFQGQQQSHAMCKLVDEMPSDEEIEEQKYKDNCDNMEFVIVNDPTDSSGLYNSRFTVEKIGERLKVLEGGDYENYTTDEEALTVCEYEHWKSCRLTDTVEVSCVLIPWLDVNEKISYAAKYLNTVVPVEFLIKKISIDLGSGTMNLTLSRYYPYYPYIVSNKYSAQNDNRGFNVKFASLSNVDLDEGVWNKGESRVDF